MKSRWLIGAAAFVLAGITPLTLRAQSPDAIATAVNSTVRIIAVAPDNSISMGTGWVVVGPDFKNRAGAAVVVTAMHVVNGAAVLKIIPAGGSISEAKDARFIKGWNENDIAFLEVKELNAQPIAITRAVPPLTGKVVALGFNSTSDAREDGKLARSAAAKTGTLSKTFQAKMNDSAQAAVSQIEFDAAILPGYSGGPLLNECGRAVGLTVKDGGHLSISPNVTIATSQGTDAAVAANELIRAAHDAQVEIAPVDQACGPGPAVTPTPTPTQTAVTPPPAPWWQVNPLLIIGLGGLAAVGVAAFLLLRKRPQPPVIGAGGPGISPPPPPPPSNASIRLSGRGPGGELIDIRFSGSMIGAQGVMLGTEGVGDARIPDARANAFVSRKHAELAYDGQRFTLTDNKSTNHSFVENKQLVPGEARTLANGETIKLADVSLHVTIS